MAKSSVKQIEKDERKILEELAKNANKNINDIAETCGVSRQKVWRVINNLEKNHTIWGYVAVVDEEKLDKKSYIILLKRTSKPSSQELIDKIIGRDLPEKGKKIGIEIINSIYTHGVYDWVIFFNANDIKSAKAFVEEVNKLFEGLVSDIHLIEKMFSAVSCGVTNPDIKKLNEFFKI
ncbi:MAG: Lrp/AsnC family transcriptional regulator [Candidatus Thermoplasmatota archaeon]|nr:Lrp/AsnC family transcriptional regulator [Candidatus Thermoplasmatota archaeon]